MAKVDKMLKAVDVNVESIRRVATKAKVSQAPQATFALGVKHRFTLANASTFEPWQL